MFRFTRTDLQVKTDRQLSALFNEITRGLVTPPSSTQSAQHMKSALTLILQEQSRRHLKPE